MMVCALCANWCRRNRCQDEHKYKIMQYGNTLNDALKLNPYYVAKIIDNEFFPILEHLGMSPEEGQETVVTAAPTTMPPILGEDDSSDDDENDPFFRISKRARRSLEGTTRTLESDEGKMVEVSSDSDEVYSQVFDDGDRLRKWEEAINSRKGKFPTLFA